LSGRHGPFARSTGIVMKHRSLEYAVRWMLAAWMLLATSITSSAVEHSHSGGYILHQHGDADSTLLCSSARGAFHDGHDGDASLSAPVFHRHGGLALLGAVIYLPMPDDSTGAHGNSPSNWETVLAVSTVQSVRTLSKSLAIDHSGLASLAVFSVGCICESKQHEVLCAGLVPAFPLCDRARHERSGVQLA
jgi:hypothetical protein